MIYALGDKRVTTLGDNWYIAASATVIGAVTLGNNVSIWFNAVVRGDNDTITIGANSNVQDSAVLHIDPGMPMTLGQGVTVGHKVMLHGCHIDDNSLIGMNAVILNGAKIGKNCIVGANTLITEGKSYPDNVLILGSPGRVARTLNATDMALIEESAQHYVDRIQQYRQYLQPQDL